MPGKPCESVANTAELDGLSAEILARLRSTKGPAPLTRPRFWPRHGWRVGLRIRVAPIRGVNQHLIQQLTVDTIDMSAGGLSFRTRHPLVTGQPVEVELPVAGHVVVDGVVRNCTRVRQDQYRVGVEFTEAASDARVVTAESPESAR